MTIIFDILICEFKAFRSEMGVLIDTIIICSLTLAGITVKHNTVNQFNSSHTRLPNVVKQVK